ncbi:MAG: biopolymer transport protein ExbD [Sulfurimonas sp.]|jgi:biopolymer transport protein ExbD
MRKKREWLTFDLTPLIDIVFLLLIFFMVFSVFKKDEFVLNVDLPNSGAAQKKQKQESLSVELNENFLSFKGKKISFEEFKEECNSLDAKQLLVLSIDKEVKYEKIVHLLDILKEKNLQNISLLVKK